MKRLLFFALAIFALTQNLQSQAQINDRTLRFGNETRTTHVAAAGDDRWLVAGTTWSQYGWYIIDSIFVASLNDAGEVLAVFFPELVPSETHFVNQLLPLPNGDFLFAFESTLCDVAFDISTVRRYNAAGEVVWEITTDFQTWSSPPRKWQVAPDGNLIGLIDNELWKINPETGAAIWKTTLFDFQSTKDPMVNQVILVPGTENLIGTGYPTLSFWRQHAAGGGAVVYTPDSTLMVPDAHITEMVAGPNGWFYLIDQYFEDLDLLRVKTDMQLEVLTLQPGSENIVDLKAADDGLYFLSRLESGNRFFKTDFNGNSAQDLSDIAPLLFPKEMALSNGKVIIGGSDGSGPNSNPSNAIGYYRYDVEHAWVRIGPITATTVPPTADAGIEETTILEEPNIESFEIEYPPFLLYNTTGGNFQVKITNHGTTPLRKVWVNQRFDVTYPSSFCPFPEITKILFEDLNLAPGASVWREFGGIRGTNQIAAPSQICFWTSGPNDEPDVDKNNDHACAEIISSTPEAPAASKSHVYPNPVVSGYFNVELAGSPNGSQWQLMDAYGRMVKTGILPLGAIEFKVEVGNLPPGIYCLKIGSEASKIVVD